MPEWTGAALIFFGTLLICIVMAYYPGRWAEREEWRDKAALLADDIEDETVDYPWIVHQLEDWIGDDDDPVVRDCGEDRAAVREGGEGV